MDYSVFDSLLDAVFILDEEKKIVYCNTSAATLCESSVRRLTKGLKFYDVLVVDDANLFASQNGTLGFEEATPYSEIGFHLTSGKKGKIQIAIQPFFESESQRKWVVMIHDVTLEEVLHGKYRGELEQKEGYIIELQKAKQELEQYSKNLEQMVQARTKELQDANRTLSAIMNSLGQGFLTFDRTGTCSNIYTKACEDVLEKNPARKPIADVLNVSAQERGQFQQWLDATFSEALPFESMKDLAQTQYSHSKGHYVTLEYYPIRNEQDQIDNLVVVATDKTIEREAQIALEKEKHFAQMIMRVIRSKDQFKQFLSAAQSMIDECIQMGEVASAEQLNYPELFRKLHTIEGEAGAYSVQDVRLSSRKAQEFLEPLKWGEAVPADYIPRLKQELLNVKISYNEFLSEQKHFFDVVGLNDEPKTEFRKSEMTDFYSWMKRSGASEKVLAQFKNLFLKTSLNKKLANFDTAVQAVALKLMKKVNPVLVNGDDIRIEENYMETLLSSLVHAFRNAVDHGIEEPESRTDKGKPEIGTVEIVLAEKIQFGKKWIRIEIKDDGKGINPEAIREKMKEKFSTLDISTESDEEVIQHVFDPGFSSKEEIGEFSGRGIGMDAIRTEAQKLGGWVRVISKLGVGTTLILEIPNFQPSQNAKISA